MLREAVQAGNELGQQVKQIMESGGLVPDDLMITLVERRISQPDCAEGFILDGFPRTLTQAEALQHAQIKIDAVIEISLADEEIIRRLSGRRFHPGSGRIYHVEHNPPQQLGKDDVTGEALAQRDDDKEATVRNRLRVYHKQTAPLLKFYKDLSEKQGEPSFVKIQGDGDVESVKATILASLK
jgi:adenylate kinase